MSEATSLSDIHVILSCTSLQMALQLLLYEIRVLRRVQEVPRKRVIKLHDKVPGVSLSFEAITKRNHPHVDILFDT